MKALNGVILALIILGAINWGLIGLFRFDLLNTFFGGANTALGRIIYTLVGIAGLWSFTFLNKFDTDDERD